MIKFSVLIITYIIGFIAGALILLGHTFNNDILDVLVLILLFTFTILIGIIVGAKFSRIFIEQNKIMND